MRSMQSCRIFLFIFMILYTKYVSANFSIPIEQKWQVLFKRFLTNHEDFQVLIFHQPGADLECSMKIVPTAKIYNKIDVFSEAFLRSEKSLNVFFLSNFSEELRTEMKIFQKYSRNIFVSFTLDFDLCSCDFAQLVPASFILDRTRNQLYSCFDENEDLNSTLILPGKLDSLQEFHRNFKNMKGVTLKIYHGNYLSLRCKKETAPDVCILEGADYHIIMALSKVLNFVPDIQRYQYKNYTNIWQEMLEDVNSGEADLVAGSVLVVSNRIAYFTSYTWSSPIYGTIFVDPIKELGLWIVIDTFDTSSYMVTILVFFIILIVMIVTSYQCSNCPDFYQNFLALLKVFVEQGTSLNRIFDRTVIKYLFSLWLILNIIISSSFKSMLSSALIKPKTYGFATPQDLLENRYLYAVDDWLSDYFQESFGPSLSKIYKLYYLNFLDTEDECHRSTFFFKFKLALVHTEFSLVYLSKLCEKAYPIEQIQNLRYIKDVNVYHAYPVKPSLPYRGVISKMILRLHASGLIAYWFHDITLESLKVKDMGYTFLKPLSMKNLYSFFMILFGGLVLASIVFILEVINGKILNRIKWGRILK